MSSTSMINIELIRNDNMLLIKNLGYNKQCHLPFIDSYLRLSKGSDLIGNRINILHIFYTISLEGDKSIPFFNNLIIKNKWEEYLTNSEKSILERGRLKAEDKVICSWNKESIYVLLWACNHDCDLMNLNEIDISNIYSWMPPEIEMIDFLNKLSPRSNEEILSHLDFYYLLNWYVKHDKSNSFSLFNFRKNKSINLDLIIARRKALEWLVDSSSDWDSLSLDT